MIYIKNVCKSYNSHSVLNNVSLDLPSSGIFALLGVNGAGKTTLISILCGVTRQDSGEIFYDDTPFAEALKKDSSLCSLIPQEFAFYPSLSVKENIEFFSQINDLGDKKRKEMIGFAMRLGQLESYLNTRADTLSGGLKRRLNLAIGLLNDPKILFLDEPTVGIDPRTREFILNVIKELSNDRRLIVYTSHYMNEIDFLADSAAIIDKGEILTSFDTTKNASVLTLELENADDKNINIINEFMPFTKDKNLLRSGVLEDVKAREFIKFASQRGVGFKQISFAPISIETLFLNLTDKELK